MRTKEAEVRKGCLRPSHLHAPCHLRAPRGRLYLHSLDITQHSLARIYTNSTDPSLQLFGTECFLGDIGEGERFNRSWIWGHTLELLACGAAPVTLPYLSLCGQYFREAIMCLASCAWHT